MTEPIKSFSGDNEFLSNFYAVAVPYEGIVYPTSEHAFQAAKCFDISIRQEIAALKTPAQSKKFGRTIPLRSDWESVKIQIMEDVCYIKFTHHPQLKAKLLATGDALLEEGNNHGDRYWGTVDGNGLNKLGFVLMRVRERLQDKPITDPTGFSPGGRRKSKNAS